MGMQSDIASRIVDAERCYVFTNSTLDQLCRIFFKLSSGFPIRERKWLKCDHRKIMTQNKRSLENKENRIRSSIMNDVMR